MNIGIDIDDTLTETSEFLTPYVAEYFSLDADYLKKNGIFYCSLPEDFRDKEKEFGKATFGRVLLNVPLKEGAKEITDKLRAEGNRIVIITARDGSIYDEPFEFTARQLSKLGIGYDKLVCAFDKRRVCIDEQIDLFIDDSIDNLMAAESAAGEVLLFNSAVNNAEATYFRRVSSWQDIYDFIHKKNKPCL